MEEASLEELERLAERDPADRVALERLDAACRERSWNLYDRPLEGWIDDLRRGLDRRWGSDDPEVVLGQAGPRAVLRLIEAFWTDPEARPAAARVLGRRGAGSVAYRELERALDSPESEIRAAAAEGLGECDSDAPVGHLVGLVDDPDPEVREAAVDALGGLGSKALAAVPSLLRRLDDDELGLSAAIALGYLGRDERSVVRALVDAAEGRLPDSEPWALLALGLTRSSAALPTLLEGLQHYGEEVRIEAAGALGDLGIQEEEVLEALRERLDDWDPWVRAEAAMALVRLGDRSTRVCSELVRAIEEDVGRRSVLETLAEVGRGAETAFEVVLDAARSGRPVDRAEALATLAAIGPTGRARADIVKSMQDPHPTVRAGAARALAILRPRSRRILDGLVRMLDDREREVEQAAARALSAIRPEDPVVRSALISRISRADPGTRRTAVELLGKIGKDVDALLRSANDGSEPVRFAALYWLAEIREKSERAMRGLWNGLLDPSARVRREGAWGLGELGSVASPAADRLADALARDEDGSVREHAAYALGEIGFPSPGAAEALLGALGGARRNVSIMAARSLWVLDVARDLARERILESLRGEDGLRGFAERTARELGILPREAGAGSSGDVVTPVDCSNARRRP